MSKYQVIDPEVRQPLPNTDGAYTEHLFLQPNKQLTSFNSDNTCGNFELLDPNDESHVFSNAALTGTAHPRTRIAPIMAVRPLDTGGPTNEVYWRDNPMSGLSILNKRRKQYPSLAGYNTEDLVDLRCMQPEFRQSLGAQTLASPLVQTIQPGVYTLPDAYDPINSNFTIDESPQFEKIQVDRPVGNRVYHIAESAMTPPLAANTGVRETYEPISSKANANQDAKSSPKGNAKSSPKGNAKSSPKGNAKSSTEPDEATETESKQPASQLPQGRQAGVSPYQAPLIENDVSVYNVFDPRFAGYGSDDRNYIEPMLNQPRFFYDDVDAIRRPNYIVRSKIDSCVTVFGDQYGPMRVDQRTLNQNRPLAEQAYLNQSLNFRNDMMESLMRKVNSEKWQTRAAPKYTTRQSLK